MLSGAVALVIALLSSREISGPILRLTRAAERVGRGHYDDPVRLIGDDEFADLGMAVNHMMKTLSAHVLRMEEINRQLSDGIGSIDDTTNALASVSMEQAGGASQQASAVQEAASRFAREVREGSFPGPEHTYTGAEEPKA